MALSTQNKILSCWSVISTTVFGIIEFVLFSPDTHQALVTKMLDYAHWPLFQKIVLSVMGANIVICAWDFTIRSDSKTVPQKQSNIGDKI